MLPARRHEISRLEAFSDAVFACFIPLLGIRLAVTPGELTRIFAISGTGFVVLFTVFGLLSLHAYRQRDQQLGPLEMFDVRAAGGGHLVSAGIGALATLIALLAATRWGVRSRFTYFLKGPGHWMHGARAGRRRQALEARLQGVTAAAATG
jgi:hypothetical protein